MSAAARRTWTIRRLLVIGLVLLSACAPAAPFLSSVTPVSPTTAAAPQPSATHAPTLSPSATPEGVRGAACLAGRWRLEDPAAYFQAALRAGQNPAQFQEAAGTLHYSFTPLGQTGSGTLEIGFEALSLTLNAQVEGGGLITRSTLDGAATAAYRTLSDEELALADFGGAGVLFLIEVDGQLLVQTDLPAWASFFSALSQASGAPEAPSDPPAEVRAAYTCAGDNLVLRGGGSAVELRLIRD